MRTHSRRAFVSRLAVLGVALPLTSITRHVRLRAPRRIGFITGNEPSLVAAFNDALRALGYVPGENLIVETRLIERGASNTAALPEAAAALARSDLDFIVAGALPYALEIRKANPVMPMVIVTCPGMVSNGFARTLEHPGGNATGISLNVAELTPKRLELLRELVPKAKSIALLSDPGLAGLNSELAEVQKAARSMGLELKLEEASRGEDIEPAFAQLARLRPSALLVGSSILFVVRRAEIVALAARLAIPAIYEISEYVTAGGLISYGPSIAAAVRPLGLYAGRILAGAKPADLPVVQPTKFELVINMKAARALGLTIPPSILARADEVIE